VSASRGLRAVALVIVLSTLLSGCWSAYYLGETNPTPAPSEMVGVWKHVESDGRQTQLELFADGTFDLKGLPSLGLDERGYDIVADWTALENASGTWEIHTYSYSTDLRLNSKTFSEQLMLIESDDIIRLAFVVSDPDLKARFLLERTAASGAPE